MITERDRNYIKWQNRAFWFYLAARACWHKEFHPPTVFLSHQVVELLLKATLIWWNNLIEPKSFGHDLKSLLQSINENVDIPRGREFTIPEYFLNNSHKYQTASRYPESSDQGYGIPDTFLPDLDRLFTELVEMVPFQFNSELYRTLNRKEIADNYYVELERNNECMDRLREHVGCLVDQH